MNSELGNQHLVSNAAIVAITLQSHHSCWVIDSISDPIELESGVVVDILFHFDSSDQLQTNIKTETVMIVSVQHTQHLNEITFVRYDIL